MIDKLLFGLLQNEGNQHDEQNQYDDNRGAGTFIVFREGIGVKQVYDRLCFGKSHIGLVHDHEHQLENCQRADQAGLQNKEGSRR